MVSSPLDIQRKQVSTKCILITWVISEQVLGYFLCVPQVYTFAGLL